jgi:5-methylcytosine-specific restriction endonuclease McrA
MGLNHSDVLLLIGEYDQIGEVDFLRKYAPRGKARSRFIVHDGKFYNMKAIWRAATAERPPEHDHSDDAQRELEGIGFDCVKPEQELKREFESELTAARKRSSEQRKRRLAIASKIPKKIMVLTTVFVRNPDVVEETLALAKGKCGGCKKPAPFRTRREGRPYLEVHHKRQLADQGEDSVENAIALCPNCHRKAHFG